MATARKARARRAALRSGGHGPVAFLAWGAVAGRSSEIGDALGGTSYALFPPSAGRRPPVLVRYAVSAVLTVAYLIRNDPRAVVATNPPVVLGAIALAWARLRKIPFALDSHPGAFGKQGDRASAVLLPVHRWLVRRAAVTLVTADSWVDTVEAWGGQAAVVHEAPGTWRPRPGPGPGTGPARGDRPAVLFVARLARDEPVEAVLAAAAMVPELDLLVTGRAEDLPPELVAGAPGSVRFVGFLPVGEYEEAVYRADAILALTTEPTSVMRAAYEAVYAGKPLIVSDWPLCRELFPAAVHVGASPAAIAGGLRTAIEDRQVLEARATEARAVQMARWQAQLASLRTALMLAPS